MKCKECGYENQVGEKLCARCGKPLPAEAPLEGATRRLDINLERPQPRWGTARLGTERKLLLHVRGYDSPLEASLTDALVLGRFDVETGVEPDVALDGYGAEEYGVSRKHAKIYLDDGSLKVVDLGSANATFMNGQKLIAHQPRILRDGDELRLGRLVCRVTFM